MATADKLAKFMSKMQGATGVNSLWLERAAKSGLLDLDAATPDDVYRVAAQLQGAKPSSAARQLELPLGPEAAEPDIRALIPRPSAGELSVPDTGYRGYSIPGAAERPMGLVPVSREIATLPRGVAPIDPGYRRGIPVDYVDAADAGVPLGPMAGRGLPYVDQDLAAQARYRQRTEPAVEYGNELDAARRFRERTTEPKSSFVDQVQNLVRGGAGAIVDGARAAGQSVVPAARKALTSNAMGAGLSAAVGAGSILTLTDILNSDDSAVGSGGEAELAADSRPAPVVSASQAQPEAPAISSTATADDNLEASATPVSPGAARRQIPQMPMARPTPATDLAEQGELKLIDGNAHLARPTGPSSAPTPQQLTADYRKERAMYDLARRTGKSIEELRKLPEFANVGAIRGGDYTRADGTTGTMRSSAARDIAAQARIDDERARMDAVRSRNMLAGRDPRANFTNAFARLAPDAQQRVIESRMINGGDAPQMDPRVQAAMLEGQNRLEAQREAMAVERERIASGDRAASGLREDRRQEAERGDKNAEAERGLKRELAGVGEQTADKNRQADMARLIAEVVAKSLLQAQGHSNAKDMAKLIDEQKNPSGGPQAVLAGIQADNLRNQQAQDALTFAERHISQNYAWDRGLRNILPWGSSEFTAQEQRAAYDALKAQYPQMPEEQARQIIQSIAARKTSEPATY